LVSVKQDAAVADDGDGSMVGGASCFSPCLGTVANVACTKTVPAHLDFPASHQQRDGKEDERANPDPRAGGDVARRNRLRLARSVGGGFPKSRRESAVTGAGEAALRRRSI
jgi:hypothetical protein